MTEQEQVNAILTAARLNGLVEYFPKDAELYKDYVLFSCRYSEEHDTIYNITDGKGIDSRLLDHYPNSNPMAILKDIIDNGTIIWNMFIHYV